MAEVRKKQKVDKYNIDEIALSSKTKKESEKKEKKKDTAKKTPEKKKPNPKNKKEKKSLWVRFRIFCHGVRTEVTKIHWPSKNDMVKYSVATIFFVIFCALFFYLIDVIFAFIQSLF